MKKKMRKIRYIRLGIVISLMLILAACVPDVSKYNDILDHWRGTWQGWYEITNATGEYAVYNGLRNECEAVISVDHMTRLWLELYQADGEKVCDFLGAYKHQEGKKYGEAWFNQVADNKNQTTQAYIVLDGESHGDDNLGIMSGRIGTEDDGMDILMHLYRKTVDEHESEE